MNIMNISDNKSCDILTVLSQSFILVPREKELTFREAQETLEEKNMVL